MYGSCGKKFREYYQAPNMDDYRSCSWRMRGNTSDLESCQDEYCPEREIVGVDEEGEEIRQIVPEQWVNTTSGYYQMHLGCNYHWGGLETVQRYGQPGEEMGEDGDGGQGEDRVYA
jgi:hypothetical protein